MKIKINAKKFTVDDRTREYIDKKLAKLDKFFPTDTEATVSLFGKRGEERVELTIQKNGTIFRAEVAENEYETALIKAIDRIERQIRKNRTRLEKKIHIPKDTFVEAEPFEAEDEIKVTKTKKFEIVPMTVEEAILQMNLLSHEFYLFRNAESGMLNVVYKRKENDYGVIEPIE
ncbi:MAG: ribosome-associated translation inhibitor RaiA [Clostridia bacterium]|nr:ribosome-associated translation inhibitor RaiA [Clostridia bacterium]MBR2915730.1 ribosome-associated translation inhibitor RaiA [Clostridia bacterium]